MKRSIILALSSGLGLGYIPIASGTFGTLLGVAIFAGMGWMHPLVYLSVLIPLILFSCWLATRSEEILENHDPGIVVIDEIVGYLVAMFTFPVDWRYMLAGFLLFRFFDIIKIYPASWFDRDDSPGYGIVLDDVVSGFYANICLQAARVIFWS